MLLKIAVSSEFVCVTTSWPKGASAMASLAGMLFYGEHALCTYESREALHTIVQVLACEMNDD